MRETRRIFVSVPLSAMARTRIRVALERWQWLPLRLAPEKNWHITVIPPFSAHDFEIEQVQHALARVAAATKPVSVTLDAITLAPPGKRARMIWVSGSELQRLQGLREAVEREFLFAKAASRFRRSPRRITPHVTLARFREGELAGLEEKTYILQKIDCTFFARELVLMEAETRPDSAEYTELAVFPFS